MATWEQWPTKVFLCNGTGNKAKPGPHFKKNYKNNKILLEVIHCCSNNYIYFGIQNYFPSYFHHKLTTQDQYDNSAICARSMVGLEHVIWSSWSTLPGDHQDCTPWPSLTADPACLSELLDQQDQSDQVAKYNLYRFCIKARTMLLNSQFRHNLFSSVN